MSQIFWFSDFLWYHSELNIVGFGTKQDYLEVKLKLEPKQRDGVNQKYPKPKSSIFIDQPGLLVGKGGLQYESESLLESSCISSQAH